MAKLNQAMGDSNPKTKWGWGVLFYGLCVFYYSFLTLYTNNVTGTISSLPDSTQAMKRTGMSTYGGPFKYLTIINLVLQAVYFFLSFLAHLTRHERLRALCEFLFASALFPLGTLVTIVFWAIYAFDRELVYPSYLDLYLPIFLNHAFHTIVIILIAVDLLFIPHFHQKRTVAESLVAVFTAAGYATWLVWIKFHAGFWVYPFMDQLTYPQFALFVIFQSAMLYGLQRLGILISRAWWGV